MNITSELLSQQRSGHGQAAVDEGGGMKCSVVKVATVARIENKEAGNAGAGEGGDEMAQHKVARLGERSLEDAEEEHRRCTERGDDDRGVVNVTEGRRGHHNGLNKQDSAKRADPSEDPCLPLQWDLFQPEKWREGLERWLRPGRAVAQEP